MQKEQRNKQNNLEADTTTKFEEVLVKIIYCILFVAFNLFEIWLVYLIAKYKGKIPAMAFVIAMFVPNKAMFGKPLHLKNIKCLTLSLVVFYVSASCVLSLNVSILVAVMIGVACGAITSYIATYLYREGKSYKELKNCTMEDFQDYCKYKKLDEDEIKIANCIIREEIKGEALYLKISYSKSQTLRIKKRIFSKLDL